MYSFEKINKINYYKQSGAGIPLCIFLPFGSFGEFYKKTNLCFPNDIVILFQNENGFIFNHYFDYNRTLDEVKKIFIILKKKDLFFEKMKKNFYVSGEKMEKVGLDIIKKKIESEEFVVKYKNFLKYSRDFWVNSLFIDLLDPFENEILDFIFAEKRKKISKEDINILISPDKLSLFQQSQMDMLKIYNKAIQKGIDNEEVTQMLKKQSDKYYWQKNDYEKVYYLDKNYFQKQLQNLIEDKKEVKNIKRNLSFFDKQKEKKKQIIKKYNLSEESVGYLNFFNWTMAYREDRKKYNQIGNYILVKIIEKISKEKKIDIDLLKCLIPTELLKIISNPGKKIKELEKRLVQGIILFDFKDKGNKIISGKTVLEYLDILEKKINKVEIKGNTASAGKIIGNVKIILNQEDFSKMEEGDVLVTSMTRPEFIPIMKKASAIVTDEGGITCHAAIVSREFGIPCITGTQNATKLLKDGDLIDVNANHGLVKIIKK